MDKLPVGQLPDLQQSNNDNEIMVITDSEHNQLKKEKISDFIKDLTSTNENNALIKGTDNKLFVTDFGNADNITEGTLPVSVLPDIPKDLLPESGVTAGTYITPTNLKVNSKGQITSISEGTASGISREDIDTVAARPLSDNACTQENFPDEFDYWQAQAHSTFDLNKFKLEGSPTIAVDGNVIIDSTSKSVRTKENIDTTTANNLYAEYEFVVLESDGASSRSQFFLFNYAASGVNGTPNIQIINSKVQLCGSKNTPVTVNTHYRYTVSCTNTANNNTVEKLYADDVLILSQTSTKNWRQNNPIWFGQSYSSSSMIAVLLPKIRVWVDDKPVFSGNKTAIDTIKAPDYTVVGSPTISADGIASGFSVSDYLTKDISDFSSVDFEFYFAFSATKSIPDAKQTFVSISLDNGANQFFIAHQLNGSVVAGLPSTTIFNTIEPDKFYFVKFAQKDGIKNVYVLDNGVWVQKGGNFTSYPENVINKIWLGRNQQQINQEPVTQGSIDLNYVSLYIKGQLAWQPCLYIPYTETTDGTKIVDAAYFDRVQSCREQTGQALYLTLDEQNQQYYLPQGTVSGMISQNKQGLEELDAKINDILYPYGFPMPSLDGVLHDNEIWLEGAVVSRTDYVNVFNVYGTTYGEGDGSTTFQLPDFRGKVPWGSADGTFGYIKAGLPNIKGEYTPTVNASSTGATRLGLADTSTGAFRNFSTSPTAIISIPSSTRALNSQVSFNASRSNSIYSDSVTTVQPPSFKVRWKTRYK